ncbi:hypothetical protein LSH36_291g00058 [Paralvinella palmiformis]|uniref:Dynein regulatory complex protein 12 n=1 Tax=Paralvinella palmiformis TaxID=53620 RepID=A0AAD9N306_9ANNE|nr:hypothetical protein LSH36_291g00058 [Paralvinella palmiformis]
MPPKKKKGKKKKKGRKDDGELTVDDKYKKTLEEVEALKDHLAVRKELAHRSQSAGLVWKHHMLEAQTQLEEREENQKAVSSEMTRQYKTMQTELSLRIHQLETELERTRLQLDDTQSELKKTKAEKEEMTKQKNLEIEDLQNRIKKMGDKFLKIFLDNMEQLKVQIDEQAKGRWAERATMIQSENKQTLLEFGLHPLDI